MALSSADLMRLGPAAQKQIMQKLTEKKPAAGQTAKEGKYHNQKAERLTADGKVIKFDSLKEARRYDELVLLQKRGKIRNLKLQVDFTLQEAYTTPEGQRVRAIRYRADFVYEEPSGHDQPIITEAMKGLPDTEIYMFWREVVEDVKSPATKTRVYEIKKKLLKERRGITIREIE